MCNKDTNDLAEIHASFINGQNFQGCEQLDAYGDHRFWNDYITWLEIDSGLSHDQVFESLRAVTRTYHKIRG
jgi:hypothetical protein